MACRFISLLFIVLCDAMALRYEDERRSLWERLREAEANEKAEGWYAFVEGWRDGWSAAGGQYTQGYMVSQVSGDIRMIMMFLPPDWQPALDWSSDSLPCGCAQDASRRVRSDEDDEDNLYPLAGVTRGRALDES